MTVDQEFEGNRLPEDRADLFGFAAVAERVSSAVLEQVRGQCFVFGLEGEWGSGKSSLLRMLQRRLEKLGAPVVRFEPWMVGPREALIPELLTGLDAAVEKLEGVTVAKQANSITQQLRNYAGGVAALGRVAGLASALGLPFIGTAAAALEKTAEAMKAGVGDKSLASLKNESSEALGKLSRRIVVLIDDIDRLEPKEAVEVLRLVQSVADFPNVTYVLCYDRARLSEGITKVTGLEDGAAYLEKIVQVVFPVPQPQRSALRNMFITRLKEITGRDGLDERLSTVLLNHIGPRLRTPRAIVRILDGLRLLWPALANEVDLADLVWLQFVRSEDVQLYRWIEAYVAEAAELHGDATELMVVRSRFAESLQNLLFSKQSTVPDWQEISTYLPMVPLGISPPEDALFTRPARDEVLGAYTLKRLRSPDHARLYFGLLRPEGAMSDAEMASFLESCRDPKLAAKEIVRLGHSLSHAGVTRLEIILDQLGTAIDRMDDYQLQGLVSGLLAVVDPLLDTARVADRTVFRKSLGRLLKDVSALRDEADWSGWLRKALEDARAVDFVTKEIETHGNQVSLGWAGDDLSSILRYLADCYAKAEPAAIVGGAGFSKVATIWQAADAAGASEFLDKVYYDDELFEKLMILMYKNFDREDDFGGLGRIIFDGTVDELFGRQRVIVRLEDLIGSASGDTKEALATVLQALSGDAVQGEQSAMPSPIRRV